VIACLGDLILDVLVRRVGVEGHESAVEQVAVVPGGAAANTAAWLAELGADVGFLGAAGNDFSGDMLVQDLELRGVRCLVTRSESRPTGILLLETASNRPPRVAARRGANDDYELDETQRTFIATVSWLHVTAYAFFSETARPYVLEAIQLARSAGASVSLDLGAPHLVSHVGAETYLDLVRSTKPRLLLANEIEADLLAGPIQSSLQALADLAEIAVLKRGSAGCAVQSGSKRFDVAAPVVEEVDSVGAGDAFAAGAIAALNTGVALVEAMHAGCVMGARCAGMIGGRPPRPRASHG
jgi:sugar/nucleoside kinase (ribokinase family)